MGSLLDLHVQDALAGLSTGFQLGVDALHVRILPQELKLILQPVDVQHRPAPAMMRSMMNESRSQSCFWLILRINALELHVRGRASPPSPSNVTTRVVLIDLLIRQDHARRDVVGVDVQFRELDARIFQFVGRDSPADVRLDLSTQALIAERANCR